MDATMGSKTCSKCGKTRPLNEFYASRDGDGYRAQCIECTTQWRKDNAEEINRRSRESWALNKEENSVARKIYRANNKEKIKAQKKKAYAKNKEKDNQHSREYYEANKPRLLEYKQQWYLNNKESQIEKNRINKKKRRKEDPVYKFRVNISRHINRMLKLNGGTKGGNSILEFLGYSMVQLIQWLEVQFEPWMTWENYGVYDLETWDDNDLSTWKWQLDHIKPHSDFHYTTMDCEDFRNCWALSNLRPLSAKINNKDGATRVRHSKKRNKNKKENT